MHCQLEMTQQFFRVLSLMTLTFDLNLRTQARFLYHVPRVLTAKFDRPTFSGSEVIVRTNKQKNKQTDADENIHLASLRYAGG